jgi:hypothetical protein
MADTMTQEGMTVGADGEGDSKGTTT